MNAYGQRGRTMSDDQAQRFTQQDLAPQVGVTRQTLADWKRKFQDFPQVDKNGKYSLDEVVAWMEEKGKKPGGSSAREKLESHHKYQQTRKTKAQADKAELELEIERGKWVSREDYEQGLLSLATIFMQTVNSWPRALGPALANWVTV